MSKKGFSKEGDTIVIDDPEKFSDHLKNATEKLTATNVRSVKIKKASIKDNLFLSGDYTEELKGHAKKTTTFSCTVPVHEDLKDAFGRLHRHLAILCDEEKAPKNSTAFQQTEFEKFGVRGFTIGGSDENEGVTISGFKDGKFGSVNLNTPFTKYEGSEYPFLSELSDDVYACIDEVEKYLFEGKRAPEKQLDLGFDEDLDNSTEGGEEE